MSEPVEQSTPRTVLVGPVLDADGAPYTTNDLAYTDFKIAKAGSVGNLDENATVSHSHQGHFAVGLQADDLDTVGGAVITLNKDGLAMPPKGLFVMVNPTTMDKLNTMIEQVP